MRLRMAILLSSVRLAEQFLVRVILSTSAVVRAVLRHSKVALFDQRGCLAVSWPLRRVRERVENSSGRRRISEFGWCAKHDAKHR